jgi:hypothetical protein
MIATIPPQTTEISTVDALWVLIQGQTKAVRKALTERLIAEQDKTAIKRAQTKTGFQSVESEQTRALLKTKVQKTMVKDSLTRAFDELHSGKVHHDARKLFAK